MDQTINFQHKWVAEHRKTHKYLTQALKGHGSFKKYTKLIGKEEDYTCVYCGEVHTAEHTVFHCTRRE